MMEIDQSISEEVSAPHTRQTTTSNEHILALSPAELPQSVLGKLTKPKRLTRHEEEVSRWLKTAEMNKSKLQRLTKDLCEEYDKHFESRHEAAQLKMDQLFRSDKLGNLRLAEVQAKVEGHFMADIRNETNLVDQLRSDMESLDWEIVQVLTTELTFHGNQLREICWLSLDEVSKYLKEQETSINVFVLQNRKFNVEETAKREIRTIKIQAQYEDKCRAFIEQWKIRRMEYIISNPVMPTFPGLPQWQQLFELQRSTVKKIENIFAKFHKIPQQIPLNETSLEEVVQWTKANIDLNSKIEGLLRTFDNAFDDMKDEIGLYLDEERQTVLKLFSECEGNPEQLSATLNGYPTIDDVKKLKRRVIFDMKTFATQFQDYSALFTAYVRSMFNMWNENWIDMSRHQDDLSIQLQENNRSFQMERKYLDTELKHLMQSIKSAEDESKLTSILENARDFCFAIEKAHRDHYSQNMTILKAQLEMTKAKCQIYKAKFEQFCNISGSTTDYISSGVHQQILKTKYRIYTYNESPQNEQEILRQPLLEQKRVDFEDSKSAIKDKTKEKRRLKRLNEYELIEMSINEDDAIIASDMINQEHFALKSQLELLLSVTAEASVQIPQFFAGMRMQLQGRVLDIMDDIIRKWTEDYQLVTERMIQKCTNKLNQDLFDHELRMKRIEKKIYQKKFIELQNARQLQYRDAKFFQAQVHAIKGSFIKAANDVEDSYDEISSHLQELQDKIPSFSRVTDLEALRKEAETELSRWNANTEKYFHTVESEYANLLEDINRWKLNSPRAFEMSKIHLESIEDISKPFRAKFNQFKATAETLLTNINTKMAVSMVELLFLEEVERNFSTARLKLRSELQKDRLTTEQLDGKLRSLKDQLKGSILKPEGDILGVMKSLDEMRADLVTRWKYLGLGFNSKNCSSFVPWEVFKNSSGWVDVTLNSPFTAEAEQAESGSVSANTSTHKIKPVSAMSTKKTQRGPKRDSNSADVSITFLEDRKKDHDQIQAAVLKLGQTYFEQKQIIHHKRMGQNYETFSNNVTKFISEVQSNTEEYTQKARIALQAQIHLLVDIVSEFFTTLVSVIQNTYESEYQSHYNSTCVAIDTDYFDAYDARLKFLQKLKPEFSHPKLRGELDELQKSEETRQKEFYKILETRSSRFISDCKDCVQMFLNKWVWTVTLFLEFEKHMPRQSDSTTVSIPNFDTSFFAFKITDIVKLNGIDSPISQSIGTSIAQVSRLLQNVSESMENLNNKMKKYKEEEEVHGQKWRDGVNLIKSMY